MLVRVDAQRRAGSPVAQPVPLAQVGDGIAPDPAAGPARLGAQASPALERRPHPEAVSPPPAEGTGAGILAAVPRAIAFELGVAADKAEEVNAHDATPSLPAVRLQHNHGDNRELAHTWCGGSPSW